jgi:L-fuculose-phosphate aldolase
MLTSMGDLMRQAHKLGLITTRDGNISVRRGNKFYITPSGVRKTIIHPEHILKAIVEPDNSLRFVRGTGKPSGELEMHRLLQTTNDFRGCRAVVHLHPTYTVAALEAGWNLQDIASRLQELSRFTKVAPNVRKLPVTSNILAVETYQAMTEIPKYTIGTILKYDIVGQAGHGVTSIGQSPWDAFEHIERLEHACQIILASGVKPDVKD